MIQPTNESQDKVEEYLLRLAREVSEWNLYESSAEWKAAIYKAKQALLSLIAEERLEELNHLGYDRRLDDPIISCYDEADFGAITLEERKQQLKPKKETL